MKITNREHPITKGVNDFVVTDEQHYVEYQPDSKYLLMESVDEDGLEYREFGTSSPAGWAYDYGKGRICYLAPRQLIEAMWNPEYEKLQKNASRWLLRKSFDFVITEARRGGAHGSLLAEKVHMVQREAGIAAKLVIFELSRLAD